MADPNAYNALLLDARRRAFALRDASVTRLMAGLREAVRRLPAEWATSTNPLTVARADAIRRQITGILSELEKLQALRVGEGVTLAARDIATIHSRVASAILRTHVSDDVAAAVVERFARLPARALIALNARRVNAASFRTLINNNIGDAAPDLDRIINAGLANGFSSQRLTKDIATLLESGYASLGDYGIRSGSVTGAATVMSDARRIAVTEINNAYREANTAALKEASIVAAAKWSLSGRHDGLPSSPDECDDIAAASSPGYPPGYYTPDDWPLAPHPHCGCYQGGPVIYLPVEQWGLLAA